MAKKSPPPSLWQDNGVKIGLILLGVFVVTMIGQRIPSNSGKGLLAGIMAVAGIKLAVAMVNSASSEGSRFAQLLQSLGKLYSMVSELVLTKLLAAVAAAGGIFLLLALLANGCEKCTDVLLESTHNSHWITRPAKK